MKSDFFWMQHAYQLALDAKKMQEVPVGAVIVGLDGILLGKGHNQVIHNHDPSAHAEMIAIRDAARNIGNYRLVGATLYSTLEPCVMCAGALVHARLKRVVFATRDWSAGALGSQLNLAESAFLNHHIQVDEGILQWESARLLSQFFRDKRLLDSSRK